MYGVAEACAEVREVAGEQHIRTAHDRREEDWAVLGWEAGIALDREVGRLGGRVVDAAEEISRRLAAPEAVLSPARR